MQIFNNCSASRPPNATQYVNLCKLWKKKNADLTTVIIKVAYNIPLAIVHQLFHSASFFLAVNFLILPRWSMKFQPSHSLETCAKFRSLNFLLSLDWMWGNYNVRLNILFWSGGGEKGVKYIIHPSPTSAFQTENPHTFFKQSWHKKDIIISYGCDESKIGEQGSFITFCAWRKGGIWMQLIYN